MTLEKDSSPHPFAPGRLTIVSGGQTGVDRVALDWALEQGLPHDGWCPKGRLAEDGTIPPRYCLRETPDSKLRQRTAWNVRDTDATLIVSEGASLSGGTLFTQEEAVRIGKPVFHFHRELAVTPAVDRFLAFLRKHEVRRLNVAGPRLSGAPGIAGLVRNLLDLARATWQS